MALEYREREEEEKEEGKSDIKRSSSRDKKEKCTLRFLI